jgi:DNA polymerase I-like protein with 3'-5' exonuclease and polymerase domains
VRLLRRIVDPEADGDLETMAELVGMGGHKEEAHTALVAAQKKVRAFVRDPAKYPAGTDIKREVLESFRKGDEVNSYAYGLLPREVRARYVARDSLSTAYLQTVLEERLNGDDANIARIYRDIVVHAARAIQQVEAWGVATDREALLSFHSYLEAKKTESLARLQKHAGSTDFNPASTRQVADLLYTRMRLPVTK